MRFTYMDIASEHERSKSHEHTNLFLGFTNALKHNDTANALKRENMTKGLIL
jgi:hypothetical protein